MARPLKKKPKPGFIDYDTAMYLAKVKGKAVRCDEYMAEGWTIRYIKSGKGYFNINPHTGSNYAFRQQAIDTQSVQWRVVE